MLKKYVSHQENTDDTAKASDVFDSIAHIDTLHEALEKAQALMQVFASTLFEDYNDKRLQWFAATILDYILIANNAREALQDRWDNNS